MLHLGAILPNSIAGKDIKNYLCKICFAFAPKMLLKLITDCDIEVSNAVTWHKKKMHQKKSYLNPIMNKKVVALVLTTVDVCTCLQSING